MKLISDRSPGAGYGSVTAEHVKASAAALTELARLVTADSGARDARPLHVRLSHFEHGGVLSLQLFGFPLLPATGQSVTVPVPPGNGGKAACSWPASSPRRHLPGADDLRCRR